MSSRFVSGGTISSTGDSSKDGEGATTAPSPPPNDARGEPLMKKNAEWEAVQHDLEMDRKRREEQRASAAAGGQQSLYDILQANKAAKQAAFEEQNKIKNQFRALDDDEAEFLDEVMAKTRAEEERVRKETEQGLKAFRERQKSGSGVVEGAVSGPPERGDDGGAEEWVAGGRKRKRVKEREGLGVRKKSVTAVVREDEAKRNDGEKDGDGEKDTSPPAKEAKKGLGLVSYGSDDSDDE